MAKKLTQDIIRNFHARQQFGDAGPIETQEMLDRYASRYLWRNGFTSDGKYAIDDLHHGEARPVQPGRAKTFDGVDDYIELPPELDGIIGTGDFSVSVWVKTADLNGTLIGNIPFGAGGAKTGVAVGVSSGKAQLFITNSDGSFIDLLSPPVVNTDVWVHICCTCDRDVATGAKLHINGASVITGDPTAVELSLASQSYALGRQSADSGSGYFDGELFDVRIYNRALTAKEVASIYCDGIRQTPENSVYAESLIGHWKLDEESTSIAYDSSGNGNDGTKSGGVANYSGSDVPFSWQNSVGYTTTDKPRDESSVTKDVSGTALAYSGQVRRNAKLVQSHCGTFDGVDDVVTVGSIPQVPIGTNARAISFWVNPAEFGLSGDTIISLNAAGGASGTEMRVTLEDNSIGIAGNGVRYVYDDGTLAINTWVHVTVSIPASGNFSDIDVHYNGQITVPSLEAGVDMAINTGATNLTIGGASAFRVCDIRIYGTALTASDASAIYNGTYIGNPVVHWPLSEGKGATIHDVTPNGHHGTRTGATDATFWDANTQDQFHYNLLYGFDDQSGVKVPARIDGSQVSANGTTLSNPSGNFHNGAETKFDFRGENTSATWHANLYNGYGTCAGTQTIDIKHIFPAMGKQLSVFARVKFTDATTRYMLDGNTPRRAFGFVAGVPSIYDSAWTGYGAAINDNAWHDVLFLVNDTYSAVYVDGVLAGSSTETAFTWATLPTALRLLSDNAGTGQFIGDIDRIILSIAEETPQSIYHSGAVFFDSRMPGCLADSSPKKNNLGTPSGLTFSKYSAPTAYAFGDALTLPASKRVFTATQEDQFVLGKS